MLRIHEQIPEDLTKCRIRIRIQVVQDERFMCLAEVDLLLENCMKAKEELGWKQEVILKS